MNFLREMQVSIRNWCVNVFGEKVTDDKMIRAYRFFEEATELVQAGGLSPHEAHMLVDYVYGRPVGELHQEIGGTMVTLLAFCNAHREDAGKQMMREFLRCLEPDVIQKIRAKQATKPNPPEAA